MLSVYNRTQKFKEEARKKSPNTMNYVNNVV